MSGKWLEPLKQVAPALSRVVALRDPATSGIGQFAAIHAVAPSLGVEVHPINFHDPSDIEHEIAAFASSSNGDRGLIVTASALAKFIAI